MAMTLVIGGLGSGKSEYVEGIIEAAHRQAVYIATSEAIDDEMQAKIEQHRQRRGKRWRTLEEPRDLAGAVVSCPGKEALLIECIATWLTNLLVESGHDIGARVEQLLTSLIARDAATYIVTNESGSGLVPPEALSRRYVAHLGRTNQRLAACADTVILVVAGLPVVLKGTRPR